MEINLLYLGAVITILVLIYRRLTRHNDYFHDKPIPSAAATPLLGSTGALMLKKISFNGFIKQIYDKYAGSKIFGLMDATTRIFVIRDPELIKRIGVKDFDFFVDRRPAFGDTTSENPNVLFSKTLVGMREQKWRDMRAILSPAFTGSKMRTMFELVAEYSERMIKVLKDDASESGYVEWEMKDLCSRAANDIIATCAFGLQVDSLKNRENEFYVMGKKMMNFNRIAVLLRFWGFMLFPGIMAKFGVDIIDREHIQYFSEIIKEAVRTRDAHGIIRPDMIQLLMQAKKGLLKHQQEASDTSEGFATVTESEVGMVASSKKMTESEFIAQCLIFFLAGFDTISTAMVFLCYEVALNPDVQQKLFEEISATEKALEGKRLTYDTLQSMTYMDMVVSESLRMWPVAAVDRLCAKDYHLNDGEGLKFTIDKGTCIWFPVYGIHQDPKYYPNPQKFDPERFSEANRSNINLSAYLPFGLGPRNCIGSRFALMEMKAIIYQLLLHFSFERTEQTQVPIQFQKGFGPLSAEKGVHLRLKLRNKINYLLQH
ncbi:probable cytochrome P450 9f2 [Wyeomyia smithii]|uniref:probable cytochrome P450 9f2 n=1 Tax=Wyeomyia smithii TaxID=174621 RepID=UPI002467E71B|nr:probable cytochrome P450 9f2 [Wyeomyia smithii]